MRYRSGGDVSVQIGGYSMGARRVAVTAGLIGGTGWLIKVLVMALQGGPNENSVPETAAWLVGVIGMLTAAGAAGSYLTRRRPILLRVAAALAAVVALAVLVGAGQIMLTAVPGDAWVQSEAVFAVASVLAVVVSGRLALRPRATNP